MEESWLTALLSLLQPLVRSLQQQVLPSNQEEPGKDLAQPLPAVLGLLSPHASARTSGRAYAVAMALSMLKDAKHAVDTAILARFAW